MKLNTAVQLSIYPVNGTVVFMWMVLGVCSTARWRGVRKMREEPEDREIYVIVYIHTVSDDTHMICI